jgi:hypothetical protein
VRRCLLGGITGADSLTRLLATVQSVVPVWRKPIGQDREGLRARMTDSATHPAALALVVVPVTESPSMTDDRVFLANWTSPRQAVQRDHPGSGLSFVSGSVINRIRAGVKARR